jgi:hypothetical protein
MATHRLFDQDVSPRFDSAGRDLDQAVVQCGDDDDVRAGVADRITPIGVCRAAIRRLRQCLRARANKVRTGDETRGSK